MNKKIYWILIAIFALNFLLSLALFLESDKLKNGNSDICTVGSPCSAVAKSDYSKLFGIENTVIGLISFPILAFGLTFHHRKENKNLKNAIKLALVIAGFFALRFIYLQVFVIDKLCPYCMTIDLLTISALFIFVFQKD